MSSLKLASNDTAHTNHMWLIGMILTLIRSFPGTLSHDIINAYQWKIEMDLTVAENVPNNSDANNTWWTKCWQTRTNMVKCCNNVVSDVSVTGPHQNSSNQKSTPNKLPTENINFVDAVRPVYCISRVFGLMPFSIVSEPLRGILKPKIQLFDGVWFLLSIFIYISMAIITYGSLRLPQDTNRSSFVLALGDSMLLIVGLIYSALIIMFDMHNRSRLVEILNKFTAFDKEVPKTFTLCPLFRSIYKCLKCLFPRCHALAFITITKKKTVEHG